MDHHNNLEGVLRRIQKLLAIANDHRANPNEAASAAAMAAKIMKRYQLDHESVVLEQLKISDEITTEDCVATAKTNGTKPKVVPTWAGTVAAACAKVNEVEARMAHASDGSTVVRFYGFKADVMVTKWMFDYLVGTILQLSNAYKTTDEYVRYGRQGVNAYRAGVARGICEKLNELHRAQQVETQSAGTSLVVAKQKAISEKFGQFKYKRSQIKVGVGSSYDAGRADGRNVDLNRRGVGGPQSEVKALR